MGPRTHLPLFAFKTATLPPELQVSMGQSSSEVLCAHNSDIMTRINSLYWSQNSPVILCMKNIVISTRIHKLHGSQTSPVVLCLQNNVIRIRNTSLYGCHPNLWFLQAKQRLLSQNYMSLWVPDFA